MKYGIVPLHKNCGLVLTHEEYLNGLRRGKAARRREAFDRREASKKQSKPSEAA